MASLDVGPDRPGFLEGKKKPGCDKISLSSRAPQGETGDSLSKYLTDADIRFVNYTTSYMLADCIINAIKQHTKLPPDMRTADTFDLLLRNQRRIASDLLRPSLMANAKRAARRESKTILTAERAKKQYLSPAEAAAIVDLTPCALEHLVSKYPKIANIHSLVIGHKGRPRKDGTRAEQRRWLPEGIIAFIQQVYK